LAVSLYKRRNVYVLFSMNQ